MLNFYLAQAMGMSRLNNDGWNRVYNEYHEYCDTSYNF